MTRARVLQEVRQMRFEELYERRQPRILTMAEAGEMLGVTERTFRRWSGRYHAEGAEGLQDRRIGRLSARAVPVDEALRMVTRYETCSTGWTVKHVHERWQTEHGGTRSSSWTKKTLQAAGPVTRATRRGAHRKKRPRTPVPGMLRHQDGSTHEWVPDCQWDLIVTLDDATTELYSAFFVEEEGTLSRVRGLQEVIGTKGLFSSLSVDRGSHYWYTEEAGGNVDTVRLTQVHRAWQPLGVTRIPTYSPEARGRSERAFRTLQDRLPKELALAGMTERAAANRYLTEPCLPQHHARCMVRATEPGTAFIPWVGTNLAEILCVQDERVVAKDNTVRVHEYPDETWPCSMGPGACALPGGWPTDRDRRSLPSPEGTDPWIERPTIVVSRPTVRDKISARG